MSNKHASSERVGGVGGRPPRIQVGAIPPSGPRARTVESIQSLWKSAAFAGCRQNEGLGRSVRRLGFLPIRRAHRRQRVLEGSRGGERRQRRAICARTHTKPACFAIFPGDTSFARFFGPLVLFVTLLARRKPLGVTRFVGIGAANPVKAGQSGVGAVGAEARGSQRRRRSLRGDSTARKRKEAAAFVRRGQVARGRARALLRCRSRGAASGLK